MTHSSPVWHPFTQHAVMPDFPVIDSAQGAYLTAKNGQRLFDAISSWWVVTHGHCHPQIIEAIQAQAAKLDQVIFAGFTHDPAEELAEKLIKLSPGGDKNADGLSHVFYSDSGSTAVEVALKMALGYWKHSGEDRTRILVMEHSYHGDTIGTMSVGERGVFNAPYLPLMFGVEKVPFPQVGAEQASLDALQTACAKGDVAAFILEPLVLGAGGMMMYSADCLAKMAAICKAHDVLLIADEVMTGWGRTGTLFASEQAKICPDILCSSKGITGGSMPLAVTLCKSKIFDAHYSQDRTKTFFHSSSYTANPIACAAAVANVRLWEEEPVQERVDNLAQMQSAMLSCLMASGLFANPRQAGTIIAVDVAVEDGGYLADIGPRLYRHFLAGGYLIRPLGNSLYLMPPYCSTKEDLEGAVACMIEGVKGL
ncbi:MAG: adenosylmethionine--8-amino-7-oxononanoate transaminase [Cohaesibacter sp.]|jgi:adenosylmethionine-8-amino-7-oxononanoate aminotransferase|nr:adenosylmethionine--8-amino-7-oxononanoate transaminase [Cohaesibacter sp.]